jgi:L,D-peptidoglycan transpeptidase YkuD (ErfK/YbiS/YcfS/YnhG family)
MPSGGKGDGIMAGTDSHFGSQVMPVVRVRAGQDPFRPHPGLLSIGDWSTPCAVGRGGSVAAIREGDGATPIGRFPLR